MIVLFIITVRYGRVILDERGDARYEDSLSIKYGIPPGILLYSRWTRPTDPAV